MNIERGNYISRVWFWQRAGVGFDVLGHLSRQLPEGAWQFAYRFRYYNDDQAHDSTDRKSGWTAEIGKMTESEALGKLAPILEMMNGRLFAGFEFSEVVIESDVPELVIHLLAQQPWCHFKAERLPKPGVEA